MTAEIFARIAALRTAFADLVDDLSPVELTTQSLCGRWTCRDVAGHVSTAIVGDPRTFLTGLLVAGGRPHRANDVVARTAARRPVPVLTATIREHAGSRFVPPLVGPRAPLADVVVHTGDIVRPLGRPHTAPPEDVATILDFLTGPRPIGFTTRGRVRGLALVATDLDRTWGGGEQVRGTGLDLVMAVCGRTTPAAGLALTGPGAPRLLT